MTTMLAIMGMTPPFPPPIIFFIESFHQLSVYSDYLFSNQIELGFITLTDGDFEATLSNQSSGFRFNVKNINASAQKIDRANFSNAKLYFVDIFKSKVCFEFLNVVTFVKPIK